MTGLRGGGWLFVEDLHTSTARFKNAPQAHYQYASKGYRPIYELIASLAKYQMYNQYALPGADTLTDATARIVAPYVRWFACARSICAFRRHADDDVKDAVKGNMKEDSIWEVIPDEWLATKE
jgi:hypothetical protein